jgi:hypothetical protein
MTMFTFGSNHITYDPEIHDGTWGARLIYREVELGGSGVVGDRQTPTGEKEAIEVSFPVIDRALAEFRAVAWELPQDSDGHFMWREGRVLVVFSPQSSYGYLYARAVVEKEGHEGETKFWEFTDQPERKELGNWPPRIAEARAAKAKKANEEEFTWALREFRFALVDVRFAITDRARTIRRNKADKACAVAVQRGRQAGLSLDEINERITTIEKEVA